MYFAKLFELAALVTLTILILVKIYNLYFLIHDADPHYKELQIGMAVSIVLMVYHIFYNNLAYNWRFSVKIASYPCGTYFCFDPWNWLLCFCFLKKPCQDRCCTSWTAVKWTLFFPAFAYLAYTVNSWKNAKDL